MTDLARIEKRIDERNDRYDVPGAQGPRRKMPAKRYRTGIVRGAVTGAGAIARGDRQPAATTGVPRRARG